MGFSFLLLDCFHRAYTRGLFTDDFGCPVSFKVIDRAIKIIKTLNALTDNIDKYNAYIPNETC